MKIKDKTLNKSNTNFINIKTKVYIFIFKVNFISRLKAVPCPLEDASFLHQAN